MFAFTAAAADGVCQRRRAVRRADQRANRHQLADEAVVGARCGLGAGVFAQQTGAFVGARLGARCRGDFGVVSAFVGGENGGGSGELQRVRIVHIVVV